MGSDFDNLGFDSSEDFGFGFEDGDSGIVDFGESNGDDTSGINLSFDSMNNGNDPVLNQPINSSSESSSDVKKTALKLVVLGALILLVVIILGTLIKKPKNQREQPISTGNSNYSIAQNQHFNDNMGGIVGQNPQYVQNTQNQGVQASTADGGWREFSSSNDLVLDTDYKELDFTITDVNHYVKDDGQIRIKTILTGAISGLTGTYDVEVPYSVGMKCSASTTGTFKVRVRMGRIGEHTVVADIITGVS